MNPATRVAPRSALSSARRDAGGRRRRVLLGLAAAVVVLAVAVWAVGFTGLLGVRTVAVTGVRTLSADQVRTAAAVPDGQPLARVDTHAVADRVRGLAGVARVAVSRSWPDTLRITVTEREGVAVVRRGGAVWLVDGGGVVFQRLATRPRSVPLLEVAAAGPADRATRAALSALTALPPPVARAVVVVRAATPESVTLRLTGGRVVQWGGAEQASAKAAVLTALLRRPGRHYDVSTPSVVTVR